MPTAYTSFIHNGEVDTKEFIKLCLRNFGIMGRFRDLPLTKEIPEFKVDDFYYDRVESLRKEFARIYSMTEEEVREEELTRIAKEQENEREALANRRAIICRLTKATKELEQIKSKFKSVKYKIIIEYAYQQVKNDLEYEKEYLDMPSDISGAKTKEQIIDSIEQRLQHAKEKLEDQIKVANNCKEWVNEFCKELDDAFGTQTHHNSVESIL